jgi:hypothetical protein
MAHVCFRPLDMFHFVSNHFDYIRYHCGIRSEPLNLAVGYVFNVSPGKAIHHNIK